jgi:hypothetical protein
MLCSFSSAKETRRSPAAKPPLQGAEPPPCQPPDDRPALGPGQPNPVARWWKRISPYSTSPNAAMASEIPALTLKSRLSSATLLPQLAALQSTQATSPPRHSSLPSPPVKTSAQVFQFIEPELSKTTSNRGLVSSEEKPASVSSSSKAEWQPGSASAGLPWPSKSIRPSPSSSSPFWQRR